MEQRKLWAQLFWLLSTVGLLLIAVPRAGAQAHPNAGGVGGGGNPKVPQGGSNSFAKVGTDAVVSGATWEVYLGSTRQGNTTTPNGWSVSYSATTTQFTVGAPLSAAITTNYEVRYNTGSGYVSAMFDVVVGISSVTFNPNPVVGGNNSTGTVTLAGAAPTGGLSVSLSSNNGNVTVPSSVTVAAGATSANFTATTHTVTGTFGVQVTASITNDSVAGTLTLTTTPSVASLTISPTSVMGGTNATGTVSLSAVAPQGGTLVSLSSSNPSAATVPSSVTVPGGQSSANFTVTSIPVQGDTSVTITATYGSNNLMASLTVVGAILSTFTISPTTAHSGAPVQFTVTLTGPAAGSVLGGASVVLTPSDPRYFPGGSASILIPPGATSGTLTASDSATYAESITFTASLTYSTQGFVVGPTRNATLLLQPNYLYVTNVTSPNTVNLGWNATATGSFVLRRAPVTGVWGPNGSLGTFQTLGTFANSVSTYADTTAIAGGISNGVGLYYELDDTGPNGNQQIFLACEMIFVSPSGATDNGTLDSRIDPRYDTLRYIDFPYYKTPYMGGLFTGYVGGKDMAGVARSVIRFGTPSPPVTTANLRYSAVQAVCTAVYESNGSGPSVTVGCQAIPDNGWTASTLKWETPPWPAAFSAAAATSTVTMTPTTNQQPASSQALWSISQSEAQCYQSHTPLVVALASTQEGSQGWAYFARSDYSGGTLAPTLLNVWDLPLPQSVTLSPSPNICNSQDPLHNPVTVTCSIGMSGLGLGDSAPVSVTITGMSAGISGIVPGTQGTNIVSGMPFTFTPTGTNCSFTFVVTGQPANGGGVQLGSVNVTVGPMVHTAQTTAIVKGN